MLLTVADFPSFSEGLSLRADQGFGAHLRGCKFPFLFGGTFIEGAVVFPVPGTPGNFPSFSEGLSLRATTAKQKMGGPIHFPSFSEGLSLRVIRRRTVVFLNGDFPSFSEGLSLRDCDF